MGQSKDNQPENAPTQGGQEVRHENHFRTLADAMPQIVWAADPQGNLTYTNERAHEYLGCSDPSRWLEFIHDDDKAQTVEVWTASLLSGKPYETEFRLLRASDQSYRWHLVRALPVRDRHGEISVWYGTCTDVTAQKDLEADLSLAKEQAEAASELKTSFLANMSHEIRTPLGAILGFTELLRESKLGQEHREYLEVITRSGHALTRVIDDILDISKVEAGKLEIEMITFRFDELLNEVIALFGDKAKGKGIFLKIRPEQKVPKAVVADPTRLRQILINIIGNAVKFTSRGGVEVSIEVQNDSSGKHRIVIEVSDSGPGMSPDQQRRLFQPFMQADSSTNRQFGGTGLGLVLSQKLAQALGGTVRVKSSQIGIGSTFTIEIIAEILKEVGEAPTQGTSKPLSSAQQLHKVKILAVDDSTDNRLLLKLFLKKEGADVIEASNGEEAVRQAESGAFDVVLMDIQMPGMDGYEAVSILRGKGYKGSIIALTAHAMLEEKRRTLASGFDGHVTKPIHQQTLIDAILGQLNR
jgi:PAS domain S-box-containing protein